MRLFLPLAVVVATELLGGGQTCVVEEAPAVDADPPAVEEQEQASALLPAPAPVVTPVVMASYETRYSAGSGRGHNIERAASAFGDGVTIGRGQTFSFNEVVGPRDQPHGYWRAHVIVDGEMIDGDGGGVCQVSSTIHAAARMADLAIDERSPHSRPSTYIPVGLDATVSWPSKDLKIVNMLEDDVVLDVRATRDPKNKWVGVLTARFIGPKQSAQPGKYQTRVSSSGQSFSRRSKVILGCSDCPRKSQKGVGGTIVWSKLPFDDGRFWLEWRSVYPAVDEIWELAPGQSIPE